MESLVLEEKVSENSHDVGLPRGLRWRGDVLWINKKIDGKRFQLSTGCKTLEEGQEVFDAFLAEHGQQKPTAGAGRRLLTDRPKLPKGLYWKGAVIWLSKMVKGQHYNLSTGTDNVTLAKKFLDDFNLKTFKEEKLGVKSRQKITFEGLANKHLEQANLNGRRAGTIKIYSTVRDNFIRFLELRGLATASIEKLTAEIIEDFKTWRATTPINRNGLPVKDGEKADKPGVAPKTLQSDVCAIGTFLAYGVKRGYIEKNPVADIEPVHLPAKAPVYLEELEIKALLEAAQSYDEWQRPARPFGSLLHDIILTYLKTGMRLEELRHLQWTDLSFSRDEIAIRQEKLVENKEVFSLPADTVEALRQHTEDSFATLDVKQRQALLQKWKMGRKELTALKLADFDLVCGILRRSITLTWNPKTKGRNIPIAPGLKPVLDRQPRTNNLGTVKQ